MNALIFLTKGIAGCGLLYGYYHFFLRNRRFHHYNRFYLLGIALVSCVLPFVHIPVNLLAGPQHPALIRTLSIITAGSWEEPITIYARQSAWHKWMSWQNGLLLIYSAGAITGLFVLLQSVLYIRRLKRQYSFEQVEQLKVYNTREPGTPFSFFRSIFWNTDIAIQEEKGQQIFRHELFHVQQQHSADILLLEVLCCIGWFNPFFHLIKKEVKAIHEFLADEFAITGNNRYHYAQMLVQHAMAKSAPAITHPFFHNHIKRRITMIIHSNLVLRSSYISRIMALPLLLILVSAFAVKLTHSSAPGYPFHAAANTITAVIDPGHGGIFPGAHNKDGLLEKDLNLSIAAKVKQLSPEYNVNVVLTRQTDETADHAATLLEDLQNRVNTSSQAHAAVFVSIHINVNNEETTSQSGFETYISKKEDNNRSLQLASAILTQLKEVYPVYKAVQQRQAGIAVIDKTSCPAILLECGYLNNPADAAFMSNAANQEKVARKILEGIVQYSNAQALTGGFFNSSPADTVSSNNLSPEQPGATPDEMAPVAAAPYQDDGKIIFTKVEQEPEYPGGQEGWRRYLFAHLHYPQVAVDKEIMGTVLVQFIVDQQGKVSDVKAISGPPELRAESIKVIKESGRWNSAVQNGKKVSAYKRQPITYKLEAKS